jgi:3'-phosphoadenosine 5'-phosphosulfate sulfotransferase (PAPS reductase)/FAD synthetase
MILRIATATQLSFFDLHPALSTSDIDAQDECRRASCFQLAGVPPLALATEANALIDVHAPVAVGVSGGKDSQAAALATMMHLEAAGHHGPRILIHADLGRVEWRASLPVCQELAAHLKVDLVVVRRAAGDLMQRCSARFASCLSRYALLQTVTLVPPWSTPAMRFCTSELKTHLIVRELRRRFPGFTVLNVTGERREEKSRAQRPVANPDARAPLVTWRPVIEWTEAQVFAFVRFCGLEPHPAY